MKKLFKNFPGQVKFSILTPLYNTDKKYLIEMIESVRAQTHRNWELCMADGSDAEHRYVQEICAKYAQKDSRIKYKKLAQNLGIAGNTNACLAMAMGDFMSFLDHDDLLTPDALRETAAAIRKYGAQFVYSDEDLVSADTTEFYNPVIKPDFDPDKLRSYNYICHFVSISRDITDKIGLLSPEYDGAQDYDYVLRATEQAKKIHHIPKILYHWRVHPASMAANMESKDYAIEAGRKAVAAHLERTGLPGRVVRTETPGVYMVEHPSPAPKNL